MFHQNGMQKLFWTEYFTTVEYISKKVNSSVLRTEKLRSKPRIIPLQTNLICMH